MNAPLWYLVSLVSLGLVIGVPSYITMSRHWPGLIAGFDAARCSDVVRVTRGVGGIGVLLGAAFVLAGLAAYTIPQYRIAIMIGLAALVVSASVGSSVICHRFTRR